MNSSNFKYPKLYAIISALAGPVSNFTVALASLYCLKYLPINLFNDSVTLFFIILFKTSAQINVILGVFNLLPIPPLDGSHLINALIPEEQRIAYYRLMPLFIIALFLLLLLPQTQNFLLSTTNSVLNFLQKLVV
jgi:Zn-dependent protease